MMTGRKCLSPDLKWRRWGDVDKGILVLLQRGWRIKYQLKANAILVTRRKITAAIFLLSVNREVTSSSGGLYILHGVWERPPANNLPQTPHSAGAYDTGYVLFLMKKSNSQK